MRAPAKLLAVPAALALVATAVPAGADHRPACSSSGSRTAVATERARVFTKPATVRPRYRVTRWYACSYRYDRRFRIATVGEPGIFETRVAPVRLAGRFVAHATFYEGPAGGSYAAVRVRDLRSGRVVASVQAGDDADPHFATDAAGPVTDLELRPTGSAAWIEQGVAARGERAYRVRRHDATGTAVLDAGADLDPTSLALSGTRLYWTKGGAPFAATLD